MAHTTFVDGVTVSAASWFNDIDAVAYTGVFPTGPTAVSVTGATTLAVFNTIATTVNAFGAASVALNIGNAATAATFAGGVTVASGKTLTLTGATVAGAPTWASNQAITLSTAAQPNITSTGTLTGLTVNGPTNYGVLSVAGQNAYAAILNLGDQANANYTQIISWGSTNASPNLLEVKVGGSTRLSINGATGAASFGSNSLTAGAITASGIIQGTITTSNWQFDANSTTASGYKISTSSANAAARNWAFGQVSAYGSYDWFISNALGGDPIAAGTKLMGLTSTGLAVTGTLSATSTIATADPGGGAGAWKLGKFTAAAVTLDTAHYVRVEIDGVVRALLVAN